MARLVFDKQRNSLRWSGAVVVPSRSMRELLLECYPDTPQEKIQVVPWGARDPGYEDAGVASEATTLRNEYDIPRDALVLLTVSRISPEKGQDLLLQALLAWDVSPTSRGSRCGCSSAAMRHTCRAADSCEGCTR